MFAVVADHALQGLLVAGHRAVRQGGRVGAGHRGVQGPAHSAARVELQASSAVVSADVAGQVDHSDQSEPGAPVAPPAPARVAEREVQSPASCAGCAKEDRAGLGLAGPARSPAPERGQSRGRRRPAIELAPVAGECRGCSSGVGCAGRKFVASSGTGPADAGSRLGACHVGRLRGWGELRGVLDGRMFPMLDLEPAGTSVALVTGLALESRPAMRPCHSSPLALHPRRRRQSHRLRQPRASTCPLPPLRRLPCRGRWCCRRRQLQSINGQHSELNCCATR